jgi:hypothetical protein
MTTASAIDISVAFATTLDTPAHVELAEQLGFVRAWLYDTPQQSPDVWMCLALAAQRTRSIGLGPGVLVPTLRHPMVNAAAAAALERIAPGRVAVGFGTGHTGRRAMGQPKPIPWNYMSRSAGTQHSRNEHPHSAVRPVRESRGDYSRRLRDRLGHGQCIRTARCPGSHATELFIALEMLRRLPKTQ